MGVGARFRIFGGPRGPKFPAGTCRRNDDLINQCQIITFLVLKSDIIENSRKELRGIVLAAPSNQNKVTIIIILPFNLVHL